MKVWEEEWTATKGTEQVVVKTAAGEWVARFSPAPGISPDYEAERAKLAAAAPAMARLLRALHAEHGDRRTFDWAYWFEEIEAELVRAGVPIPEDDRRSDSPEVERGR